MTDRTPSAVRVAPQQQGPWSPPPMRSIEDTGLNLITIADLVIKVMYFGGIMSGSKVADVIKLPYTGIVDQVMEFLKREKQVEVKGQGGLGEASFRPTPPSPFSTSSSKTMPTNG